MENEEFIKRATIKFKLSFIFASVTSALLLLLGISLIVSFTNSISNVSSALISETSLGMQEIKDQVMNSQFSSGTAIESKVTELNKRASRTASELAFQEINSLRIKAVLYMLVSILVAFLSGTLLSMQILKPIERMGEATKIIATGNLTQKLKVETFDEIGELSHSFNRMITNLAETVNRVQRTTIQVASAATEISHSCEQMNKGAIEQDKQVDIVTSILKNMTCEVSEISQRALNARVSVNELSTKSDEIDSIVQAINEIAGQTNLLALNAAIEAARAGEHGRGFEVVADEVRKLAERTVEATEEIGGVIKFIQDSIGKTSSSIMSIAESIKEQDDKSQSINEAKNAISNVSKTTLAASGEIASATQDLANLAEELQQLVEKFVMKQSG
jgi:methyl-accepting chemotaxis protein